MESGDTAASHSMKEKQQEEEVFKVLEALCGRIRKLLETGGRVTDDRKRHCLAFMEMEVSALVESRRLPPPIPPPWADCDGVSVNSFLEEWLNRLASGARVIDDFVDKEGGRQVGRALLQKAARPFRRRKLSKLLRTIQWEAYKLYCAAEECCGFELPSSQLRPPSPPPPQAAKACDLVGIDGPAKKLLRCLTAAADDDKSLRVMYIVGPTGVGKTTLAMELHRRLRCQTAQHFQCCAAASFSRSSDRCSLLLQSVLLQIVDLETWSPHNSETTMLDNNPKLLARSISERLQDKRYLILIDGICNDSDWEIIKGAFPNNNCGSQMLITTRDELMIRMCFYDYDVDVHNMEPLSDSDSERLLRTKAFGSMDDCLSDNLKLLCDEILTKCEGIPLFIIGMADWLKQHQQQQESSAVHRTDQVRLLLKQFRQMLSFECDDELSLPSLYLSMFPQGRVFDKHSLLARETVVKWFKIFSKLVDKNIITPVADCSLNVDEDESCQWQVNPFMLHLFASKAAETGFAFTSTTLASARGSSKMTQIARHLALHHPDPQLQGMLQEMDLSHTRSLLISGAVDRISIPLGKFAYLVMLDLHGWENLKDEDLLQICKMFMLRYLRVSSTRISKLPPQIMELSNLKTLDISHTDISELPSEITICRLVPDDVKILANLKKLERLVLGLEFIPGEEIVIECEGFKELQRFCLDCPVPWLTFREGAMPKLQRLQLKICSGPANQESAVPSGLTNLRSTTEIVICYSKWCSNSSSIKMTVEAVRKQVAMHLNGIDLVIINGKENKTVRTATKNECESEDVEAFDEEAESAAECGTEDDFDAADEEAERRATHIQSDIEEIECETEIHA
ncbi:hypothetical protein ABZP36_023156 [Zizania latifolia]